MNTRALLLGFVLWNLACLVNAAEAQLVYHQSSGTLLLDGSKLATGYSGKGEGKNNPDKEAVKNVGPIPCGKYKLGKPRHWKGMDNVFDLIPDGHAAKGRSGFLIHGDSKKDPGNASEGCIILSPDVRKKIAEMSVDSLVVEK